MAAKIGAILLAAGSSRRMGAVNKLLIAVDGHPMVAWPARAAAMAELDLIVVTGCDASAVAAAIASPTAQSAVGFVHAPDHAAGMAHSLAAGVAAAPPTWDGAIVLLADMPGIAPALLARLAAAITTAASVAVPVHDGRRGNPVAWGRAWFPRLAALDGDTGGRALLATATVTEIAADAAIHIDIDTPEALAGWHAARDAARGAASRPPPRAGHS